MKEKLNKKSALAYSVGYSGINVCWYMINNYLLLFYTDVVGLAASAISMIMLVARIWDAVNDPMMGAIVDRTNTRWGKFKPYIVIAPPFLAIFNILTFTVFPVTGGAKVITCLITYILVGMAYTVVQVAVNGFVNRLSKDPQGKMDIISMSQVGSSIIQTILGAVAMPLILYFGHSEVATGKGFFWATVLFSVVSIPMFWVCAIFCKEIKDGKEDASPSPKTANVTVVKEKKSFLTSAKAVARNKMLLIAIFSVFVGAMSAIARMSLLSYYLIYVAGAYTVIAPTFTIISVMQMVGNAILPIVTRKFGKIRSFVTCMSINAASLLVLFVAPAGNVPILLTVSAIYGLTNAGPSICYAFICDSIEYGDYISGVRDDALAFSFMSLAVKVAQAITGAGGILLISAVGYVANQQQTPQAQTGINVIVNLVPAILGIISLIPMKWYTLNEEKMREIGEELKLRRSGN